MILRLSTVRIETKGDMKFSYQRDRPTSEIADDVGMGDWSGAHETKGEGGCHMGQDFAVQDGVQADPGLLSANSVASRTDFVLALAPPVGQPRLVVMGIFLPRGLRSAVAKQEPLVGYRLVNLDTVSERMVKIQHWGLGAHIFTLGYEDTELLWRVGGQLLCSHLGDDVECVAPGISSKLPQGHFLCELAADIVKSNLVGWLETWRHGWFARHGTYGDTPILRVENERLLVHNTAIEHP
jgi:hypothetical protein